MSTEQAILTLIVTICVFLSLVSFFRGDPQRGSRSFGLMSLAAGLWALITFFEEEAIQFHVKPLLVSLDFSLALAISTFFFTFSYHLVFRKSLLEKKWLAASYVTGVTGIALLCFTPLVISGVRDINGSNIDIDTGNLFTLYASVLALNFLTGIYFLVRTYLRSKGQERSQLMYVTLGLFISITIALATNLILPEILQVSSIVLRIGIYSMIFFLASTTIAITRHGLFDIKVLATQLFVALLLLAMLGRALTARGTLDLVFELFLLILSSIFGYFLVKSVQSEIARRREIEKLAQERIETLKELEQRNKNLAALQKVSKLVLNQIEMKPMIQAILDEIPKQFESCNGALLNLVHGGHLAAYAISSNEFTKKIYGMVGSDIERYSYPIKKGFNLLHDTLIDKQIKESTRVSDFICPPIAKPIAATIQGLMGMKYIISVPLFAGKEPLGVMMFVYRVPKEQLLDKDVEMAVAISDETSLAIQRAYAFQQLKDANEYLADLDKLKDEFISIASHELNTPLAAVEGYLSMILDENMGKVDDKARMYLTRAYDSSKRLAELILDLLNVSRIEQGRVKMKFAKVNLYDLAESVLHELQVKADAKKLGLKLDANKAKVPETWCDPDRIREVIVNLVGNAIKYSDKGGITIRLSSEAGRLRCEVIDTGRGISEADQKKLFQKFSQVKREIDEHQGTGLGLYISKNFVELHKGRIWVESEEGKGSDFIFELPILAEAPEKIDGAILEGPLSAPKIVLRDKRPPAAVTASARKAE